MGFWGRVFYLWRKSEFRVLEKLVYLSFMVECQCDFWLRISWKFYNLWKLWVKPIARSWILFGMNNMLN